MLTYDYAQTRSPQTFGLCTHRWHMTMRKPGHRRNMTMRKPGHRGHSVCAHTADKWLCANQVTADIWFVHTPLTNDYAQTRSTRKFGCAHTADIWLCTNQVNAEIWLCTHCWHMTMRKPGQRGNLVVLCPGHREVYSGLMNLCNINNPQLPSIKLFVLRSWDRIWYFV